jgi:hypothetical protein
MAFPSSKAGVAVSPAFAAASRTTNTSGLLDVSDDVILVNAANGPVTMILPTAAAAYGAGIGSIFTLKKIDASANGATLSAQSGQMIDGAPSVDVMTQYETITVQSNGVSYDVLFRGY